MTSPCDDLDDTAGLTAGLNTDPAGAVCGRPPGPAQLPAWPLLLPDPLVPGGDGGGAAGPGQRPDGAPQHGPQVTWGDKQHIFSLRKYIEGGPSDWSKDENITL